MTSDKELNRRRTAVESKSNRSLNIWSQTFRAPTGLFGQRVVDPHRAVILGLQGSWNKWVEFA